MAGLLSIEDKLREPRKALEFGTGDQLPGILGLALLNQARRTIPAAYQAFTAPGRAYAGQIDPEDMLSEAQNLASMVTLGSGAIPAQANALRMGAGIPKSKTSAFYHPASRLKFDRPPADIQVDVRPMNTLAPAKTIDIADIMGEVAVPAYGDRTITDAMIHGINGEQFLTPTHAQGGVDFMRKLGGTAGWASEPSAMATKAKFVQAIGQKYDKEPILTYTAMGAQAGDFSRHMADAVMQQLRPSMHNMIDPRVVKKYDAFVRDKIDPKWPGILSPKTQPYLANDMTGSDRRLLWQELDKKKYRDAGFPSIGPIRLAITDPRLANVDPFATGLGMSKVDLSAPLVETAPELHSTYRSRMPANYIGGLLDSVPGNLVWRDFFNARRASGAGQASDQRSFMMNPSVNQVVDQQMVDEVSKYLEDQLKAKR